MIWTLRWWPRGFFGSTLSTSSSVFSSSLVSSSWSSLSCSLVLSSDTVDSVAAKVLALLGRFGLPRGLPRGALAFIFVESRASFLVGGSGSRGDKPDPLPIEDEITGVDIFWTGTVFATHRFEAINW